MSQTTAVSDFLHFSVDDARARFPWRDEDHPSIKGCRAAFDPWKLQTHLEMIFRRALPFQEIADVVDRLAAKHGHEVDEYYSATTEPATIDYGYYGYALYPELELQAAKLRTVIRQPEFIRDERAAEILSRLVRCYVCSTVRFAEENGRPGSQWGPADMPAFHRIICTDALWEGRWHGLFFGTIAQFLRRIVEDRKDLLLQTLIPRIDLLERNKRLDNRHFVWCQGSIREWEMEELRHLAWANPLIAPLLDRVEWGQLALTEHWC